MSQFININVFDASLVMGTKEGKNGSYNWYAVSGRGVDVREAQERFGGMLFFGRGPVGYSLQEQLKSNPFAQGSQVEVTLHVSEDLEFSICDLTVKVEGKGAKAVRPVQKKASKPESASQALIAASAIRTS